jgi:hypothetical protein
MSSLREANAALNHQEFVDGKLELSSYPTMVFIAKTLFPHASIIGLNGWGESTLAVA